MTEADELRQLAERFEAALSAVIGSRPPASARESQVAFRVLGLAMTYAEAGADLGIAGGTAKEHMARLATKCGLSVLELKRRLLLQLLRVA